MQSVVTMVESGSVLLLSVLAVSAIRTRFADRFWLGSILLGLLFAAVGVMVMENAVEIVPGIRTDPRGATVVLSAAFGGPVSVAVTASCLAVLRLIYGGVGAVPGAAYILGVGLVACLAWYCWFRIMGKRLTVRYVLLQAVIAGTVPTLVLLMVSKAPWEIWLVANGLLAPTNFVATLLMGVMLVRDLDRSDAIKGQEDKQDQIDAISEHAPVALFQIVRDADGDPRFTYVSKAAERIIGVPPHALLEEFGMLDGIADTGVADVIEKKLRVSETEFTAWSHEMECDASNGSERWIHIHAGIRKGRDGQHVWDGSILDITEQKISEKLKDEFISTVSHELRTPLTSIRGSLGLVIGSAGADLPPKLSGMLDIANRNAERLVLLINDILDMQKIRSGQMSISMERQEVRSHVDDAIACATNYAPQKKIRFTVDDLAPGSEAKIDSARLGQVLGNLLSNAIKFSAENGSVRISIRHVGARLRISVADAGPGIPVEFRDRIFKPFSQHEKSTTRSVGGTGLGLNISKALVQAMDGELWFESIEGHGATFHIDLPAIAAKTATGLPVEAPGADRRVLICSGDEAFVRAVANVTDPLSLVVDIAGDIDAAYDLSCRHPYAVLVLDAAAIPPKLLMDRLSADDRTRNIPVVVASNDEAGDHGASATGSTWIATPVEEASLRAAIDAALSTRSHILYVEDDTFLHEIIQQHLGESISMTSAGTLTEAREHIASRDFDLILLDLELPDGAGHRFVKEIAPTTPIIVFSAYDLDTDIAQNVKCVMTKSRVKEAEVAETVIATLAEKSGNRAPGTVAAA